MPARNKAGRVDYVGELVREFGYSPTDHTSAKAEGMYMLKLAEAAQNRFIWTGLPEPIDERYVEKILFTDGMVAFFRDAPEYAEPGDPTVIEGTFHAQPAARGGRINMYDNPTEYTVTGNGVLRRRLPSTAVVPIWCNNMRIPDSVYISGIVERIARVDDIITAALETQRHPFIVAVGEDERLTMQNVIRQTRAGEPVIWGTKALAPNALMEQISVLNLNVPSQQVLDLFTAKARLWNEAMTLMGVENANTDKKERMISNEVSANDGQVQMFRQAALAERQRACERINARWGLNIWCSWNEETAYPGPDNEIVGGGL